MICKKCLSLFGEERIAQVQIDSKLIPGTKVFYCYDHIQELINDHVITWENVEPAFDYDENRKG